MQCVVDAVAGNAGGILCISYHEYQTHDAWDSLLCTKYIGTYMYLYTYKFVFSDVSCWSQVKLCEYVHVSLCVNTPYVQATLWFPGLRSRYIIYVHIPYVQPTLRST